MCDDPSQRAIAALLPKLPSLHPDLVSRLYTTETWHEKVKALCFDNVELSAKDAEVLAKQLADGGLCVRQGEVRCSRPSTDHPFRSCCS